MGRRLLAGIVVAVSLAAGCSSDAVSTGTSASTAASSSPSASPSTSSSPTSTSPTSASPTSASPTSTSAGEAEQPHVSVLGLWSGPEHDSFVSVARQWEEATGGVVDWTGAQDLPAELHQALAAGTPPDLAILPNVGLLHELAGAGELVPLSTVLDMERVAADYSPAWLDLGSDGGDLYGLFVKLTDKSTVWYDPAAFAAAGYSVPSTWDDMVQLAGTIVADGGTPFSVVAPRLPGGGGWALTDVVSQIVLGRCGVDVFDRWVAGEVPWTDACIAESFGMFDTLVHTPGWVRGGDAGILATSDADGSFPMYTDPPGAYMYPLASFAQAFITARFPQLVAGDDYASFPFPTIDPANAGAVTIGGDIVVVLHDTPAARSFLDHLAGADAQEAWVGLGGFTSVNRNVPLDAYPDAVSRSIAEHLTSASVVRYSAGDSMPSAVQQAWWQAMVTLVQDPTQLPTVLASMTETATAAAGG